MTQIIAVDLGLRVERTMFPSMTQSGFLMGVDTSGASNIILLRMSSACSMDVRGDVTTRVRVAQFVWVNNKVTARRHKHSGYDERYNNQLLE